VCDDLPTAVLNGFINVLDLAGIILSIGGMIGIIVGASIPVALICTLLIAPVVVLAQKSGNEAYDANAQIAPHARRASYLRGVISSREAAAERKLFGFSGQINQYWNQEMDVKIRLDYQADLKIFVRSKGVSILFALLLIAMAVLMLRLVEQKTMSVGVYIGLIISFSTLIHTLSWQLSEILTEYTEKRLYLEDLKRLEKLTEIPGSDAEPDLRVLGTPFASLVFNRVSFTYPGSYEEVLHDISLDLQPGKQYALVGKNGCGKSTLIKLLAGLYTNYSGRISLNQQDIHSFTAAERKAYFSIVYQDYARYWVTFREQISLGNSDLTDEEIDALFCRMDLGQKIKSFPQGLDTPLGKLGPESSDLSEGQWQRVNLARSFSRSAKLFIFDEPAAALDALAENKLYETIQSFSHRQPMTVLYITHRLAAAKAADEIIVMDGGRIVERGAHADLLAAQGHYAKMFESQAKWYQPRKAAQP
jgi:ATP-binding cassette subfamily B protein